MTADRLIDICVSLHRRQPVASIGRKLGISAADLQRRLDSLLTEGLVKRSPRGQFVPTCMVVTIEDARWMASPGNMVPQLAQLVVDRLSDIRERSESIPAIRRAGFSRNTLLILSNVLLDNWQIRNVEKEFLKTERPLRNGRRYYYAIFEKPASQRSEAFGIYGNGGGSLDGIEMNMYGKQRYDGNTLLSISDADFKRLFGLPPQEDIGAAAKVLLERLVLLARTGENRLDARE